MIGHMEKEKKRYINDQMEKMAQDWAGITSFIGTGVFLVLGVLDYFVTPENFSRFLVYRLVVSTILMLVFYLNKLRRSFYYQSLLFIFGTVCSAVAIELMILSFGGHKSPYQSGMHVLIIAVLGLVPLELSVSVLSASLIYLIYLLPILFFDQITEPKYFIVSNAFMSSIFAIALLGRFFNQKKILNELALQFDISRQKEQLRIYSTHLEELVEERTKELAISEQRYRELFDSANDGVVVFDGNGIMVDVNKQFCAMYGYEKSFLIGAHMNMFELENHEDARSDRMERILAGEPLVFETEHVRKNGDNINVEVSSKAIIIRGKLCVQSFHRDITDKKRLMEQLYQSQKMEAIGVLAGGIAHDFNNFLAAILAHSELLCLDDGLDAGSRRRVMTIESSARKAGQIVSRLLSFARKEKVNAEPLNFNDILKDAHELLGRVVSKKGVELKMALDENIPIIKGDATQLEQVIMNLVMNAADAMPEGGSITLSTSTNIISNRDSRIHPMLTPGRYIKLKVADTGTGIPDEIKDKIFDPFFTTKGPEKGTGLGLAIIYGIVREHNGVITMTSLLGRGTTFDVYLPAIRKETL
jgi:PAS domain S-box-containing protein